MASLSTGGVTLLNPPGRQEGDVRTPGWTGGQANSLDPRAAPGVTALGVDYGALSAAWTSGAWSGTLPFGPSSTPQFGVVGSVAGPFAALNADNYRINAYASGTFVGQSYQGASPGPGGTISFSWYAAPPTGAVIDRYDLQETNGFAVVATFTAAGVIYSAGKSWAWRLNGTRQFAGGSPSTSRTAPGMTSWGGAQDDRHVSLASRSPRPLAQGQYQTVAITVRDPLDGVQKYTPPPSMKDVGAKSTRRDVAYAGGQGVFYADIGAKSARLHRDSVSGNLGFDVAGTVASRVRAARAWADQNKAVDGGARSIRTRIGNAGVDVLHVVNMGGLAGATFGPNFDWVMIDGVGWYAGLAVKKYQLTVAADQGVVNWYPATYTLVPHDTDAPGARFVDLLSADPGESLDQYSDGPPGLIDESDVFSAAPDSFDLPAGTYWLVAQANTVDTSWDPSTQYGHFTDASDNPITPFSAATQVPFTMLLPAGGRHGMASVEEMFAADFGGTSNRYTGGAVILETRNAPSNDNLLQAVPLSGQHGSQLYSTVAASVESGEDALDDRAVNGAGSIWYGYDPAGYLGDVVFATEANDRVEAFLQDTALLPPPTGGPVRGATIHTGHLGMVTVQPPAASYPPPLPRLQYDADGSTMFWFAPHFASSDPYIINDPSVANENNYHAMPPMRGTNSEPSNFTLPGIGGQFTVPSLPVQTYFGVIFPDVRKLYGLFLGMLWWRPEQYPEPVQNPTAVMAQYSTDTTNGHDGTWHDWFITPPNYGVQPTSVDNFPDDWRTDVLVGPTIDLVKGIRIPMVLVQPNAVITNFHLYGEPSQYGSQDRLFLWEAGSDTRLDPSTLDFGTVLLGQTYTRQFRVYNASALFTARNVQCWVEALGDTPWGDTTTPTQMSELTMSIDGGVNWHAALMPALQAEDRQPDDPLILGDLLPGGVSPVITLRRMKASNSTPGLFRQRVRVRANGGIR